jgi:16S rRNA (cytosine1402-N4)-methyltransferase
MHQPVLLDEVLAWLAPQRGGVFVDGTLGSGGHARAIAERISPEGRLLAMDRDAEAIDRVRCGGGAWLERCTLVHGNFADVQQVAAAQGFSAVDGMLLDLGVSSEQLGAAERGFSFQQDGPLDMRMDRAQGVTAAELVNTLPEEELAGLLWRYGEERHARRIARALVQGRAAGGITRTGQLADAVVGAQGGMRGRIHPATRAFQALRIAVNEELAALERGLAGGLEIVKAGGRVAVIAFHSLEDRVVKQFFVAHAGRWESLAAGGRRWIGAKPEVRILTKKPVIPSADELNANPRARSAKLRVAERKD